jgi:hypothetical protein
MGHFKETPNVAFTAEFGSGKNALDALTQMIESHLRERYGSFQRGIIRIRQGSDLHFIKVREKEVSVHWRRSRRRTDEWIVTIGPEMPRLLDFILGRQSTTDCSEELKLVSRGIQAVLTAAPEITRIRWYFKGLFEQVGTAVWTPDELPWAKS